jgi:hypothetical protein
MSHKKLRTDPVCLNCGNTVDERFCSVCGQENLEMDDSAFHLMIHYFQDLFHYDGKFWLTFKNFVTKPGLVQEEYIAGKRQRHLKPIQFYVFASTVFFFFFFFMADPSSNVAETSAENLNKRVYHLKQEREFRLGSPDTVLVDSLIKGLMVDSAAVIDSMSNHSLKNSLEWDLFDDNAGAIQDSHWLNRFLAERVKRKADELNRVHQGDKSSAIKAFLKELLHTLPQLMFFSLPFFALFLQLLYFRSGQKRYVANFIFSIYHYAYLYTILFFYLLYTWLTNIIHLEVTEVIWGLMTFAFIVYLFVYLYLSMRRFYQDKGITLMLRYPDFSFLGIQQAVNDGIDFLNVRFSDFLRRHWADHSAGWLLQLFLYHNQTEQFSFGWKIRKKNFECSHQGEYIRPVDLRL